MVRPDKIVSPPAGPKPGNAGGRVSFPELLFNVLTGNALSLAVTLCPAIRLPSDRGALSCDATRFYCALQCSTVLFDAQQFLTPGATGC